MVFLSLGVAETVADDIADQLVGIACGAQLGFDVIALARCGPP